jgi:hypothetical protein
VDRAYASFLYCGVSTLAATSIGYVPMKETTQAFLIAFILAPILALALGVVVFGIKLSIKAAGHPVLRLLAVLSALAVILMFARHGGTPSDVAGSVVYGLVATLLPLRWFLYKRPSRPA